MQETLRLIDCEIERQYEKKELEAALALIELRERIVKIIRAYRV